MAQNVSSVRVAIQGDARGLNAELTKASKAVSSFANHSSRINAVGNELNNVTRKGPNVNFMVTQLGYAAEDAAVSFGTAGLAGALRGASNNLSVVAMQFGPIPGLIVGVGTALASSLIPMLEKSSERSKQAASDLQTLGQQARRAYIDLQEGRGGIGTREAEPVVPVSLDRFQSQRKTFEAELASMERKVVHFQRETGFALGKFQQSLPTELSSSFLADPGGKYDFDLTRVQEVIRSKLSDGLRESIESGSALPLEQAGKNVQEYIKAVSASTGGHSLEEILPSESFKSVMDDLFGIARQSIIAREEIEGINSALTKLGQNEGIAKGTQSLVDALNPVFQVGGRFGDRFQSLFDAAKTEFGGVRARRDSDPLQAGHQFGSIEAVSAINRATFARPDPVDKNIEKNTSKTVDAVIGVAREVKHMKTAVVSAVTNSIKVGAGL